MHQRIIATAVAGVIASVFVHPAQAQDANASDVDTLARQLQALKADYAQEVRRLRELDAQVQALQARLAGKAGSTPLPADTAPGSAIAASADSHADAREQAAQAQADQSAQPRSLQDALQQEHALFNRKLTIENGISYAWYDRKQLTLNGFLALDAIFLGNIALQDVKSNTFTYNLAVRYGVTPRLTLNVEVPYLARKTSYFQGGAGGAASAIQEESTRGNGIGDTTVSANYKLFTETEHRPDTVVTLGVTAPTGQAPYGIDWNVPGGGDATDGRFAVPAKQPTGNGLWQANLGISAIKTMDPAIVFANLGYIHAFSRGFGDIDTDPQTVTPGKVRLGDAYYFGAGVAFAFNERTSLSLAFSDKVNGKAALKAQGGQWQRIIGSDANAASFNMGVTYALSQHTTLVTMLGIGLTPDAPNYMLTFKVPYIF